MATKKKKKKHSRHPADAFTDLQFFHYVVAGTLSCREYLVLTLCPYENPAVFEPTGVKEHAEDRAIAIRLVEKGLLERNPTNRNEFRCTERGEAIRVKYERER